MRMAHDDRHLQFSICAQIITLYSSRQQHKRACSYAQRQLQLALSIRVRALLNGDKRTNCLHRTSDLSAPLSPVWATVWQRSTIGHLHADCTHDTSNWQCNAVDKQTSAQHVCA